MTENIKKFIEAVEQNEELRAQVEAQYDKDDAMEQLIAIAKEHGYTLTAEDFEEAKESDALSLDQLDSVAGGKHGDWLYPKELRRLILR